MTGKRIGIMAVIAVCALACRGQAVKPDERGLWDVWCVGTNSAFVAQESLKACIDFTARAPRDPFVTVMSGFAAWHHLKNGNTEMAVRLFESMLIAKEPATALQKAGDQMARSWLTRLDRERVVRALKKAYLRDIAFPASLEALKAEGSAPQPPLTDRWGKPWAYRLSSSIKGMEAHRYVLESPGLGADSDLRKALKRPYADGLQLRAVRMAAGITDTVEFVNPEGVSVRRRLGQEMSGGTLVYLGTHLLLLSDGNHWSVLPRPR
ncbi:MAG: hypothetical protein RBT78_02350 [Kiritimatiellia bacterium]|jgi:hypothetical protein|nr:hypothetical protein [Kiritimatiellia bacterium]